MVRLTSVAVAVSALSAAALVIPVAGFEKFVARLPNGANVPGVEALGHVNPEFDGTGDDARNDFGEDFEDMGELWTKELCEADSDDDGQTNGQELGDPCCEWNAETASTPRWTEGVSHPGDATKKSDVTLWASIDCSKAAATIASAGSMDDDSDTEVGDSDDKTSTSESASTSGSSTPAPTTSNAPSGAAISAMAGFISLLLALAA
ncbi:hypothetical protein PHYSODRAFT_565122 [Phytophthora sojae]|uniref:Temptin Cys/Cys disulfide domain-containing protein n=1 Tax=Phytophthora sojae (strain P6497) TaxID=1094619 RepID=G5A8N1_PHYSP|nr:hypothetical protein PHYSODRAFT_565122 [Phytophthora sojae]EGZ08257.1 hypothetical protein PHYSODRAFT_565122 [Phytophthora sojae]|eukprot:XP_009536429.1 hypothetical protein PHYSODRAFT_565122 [Phytophthora sojae]